MKIYRITNRRTGGGSPLDFASFRIHTFGTINTHILNCPDSFGIRVCSKKKGAYSQKRGAYHISFPIVEGASGAVARTPRQPRDYAAHAASPTREQTIPD